MVIDEAGANLVIQCAKCAGDVLVPNAAESTPDSTSPMASTQRPDKEKESTVALAWTPPTATKRADPKS
jgi:hypothetical protein